MRYNHPIGLAAALTLLVPGVAGAQSTHSQMGSRATATVRITVSVVPRFRLAVPPPADTARRAFSAPGAMTIASNAGVRYQLVADPASVPNTPLAAPADTHSGPLRLLVVPD